MLIVLLLNVLSASNATNKLMDEFHEKYNKACNSYVYDNQNLRSELANKVMTEMIAKHGDNANTRGVAQEFRAWGVVLPASTAIAESALSSTTSAVPVGEELGNKEYEELVSELRDAVSSRAINSDNSRQRARAKSIMQDIQKKFGAEKVNAALEQVRGYNAHYPMIDIDTWKKNYGRA